MEGGCTRHTGLGHCVPRCSFFPWALREWYEWSARLHVFLLAIFHPLKKYMGRTVELIVTMQHPSRA